MNFMNGYFLIHTNIAKIVESVMMCEIYTASKWQRFMYLVSRYSILASVQVKCKICGAKFDAKEMLNHYNEVHSN